MSGRSVAAGHLWTFEPEGASLINVQYTVTFYEGSLNRGEVVWRGEVAEAEEGKKARLLTAIGDPEGLSGYVTPDA